MTRIEERQLSRRQGDALEVANARLFGLAVENERLQEDLERARNSALRAAKDTEMAAGVCWFCSGGASAAAALGAFAGDWKAALVALVGAVAAGLMAGWVRQVDWRGEDGETA